MKNKEQIIEVPNAFFLDGEINARSRRQFCTNLDIIAQTNKDVGIIITSKGGAVDELCLMVDQMDRVRELYGAKIRTIAQGYVYSGGAILACLGDERYAFPNTTFFFHDVQMIDEGDLSKVRDDVKNAMLDKRRLEKAVCKRAGIKPKDLKNLYDKHLTANQALENHLIDAIIVYERERKRT